MLAAIIFNYYHQDLTLDMEQQMPDSKVTLPEGYEPSDDEEYMNPMQLEYFRQKLLAWREDLLNESRQTLQHLKEENWHEPDPNDRATVEVDASFELRTRDRYRKFID